MAKEKNNIFLRGLSGMLGNQFVIKRCKDGSTIITVKPTFSTNREFTDSQKKHQQVFKEATAYAKSAKTAEVYLAKAEGTAKNAYNVAIADWFHKPEILKIDTNEWHGQAGQPILIEAQDDVQVKQVSVAICDEEGMVLEQGNAVSQNDLWWVYKTATTIPDGVSPQIKVIARDLPGNSTEKVYQI
jgi:hypothetical protein